MQEDAGQLVGDWLNTLPDLSLLKEANSVVQEAMHRPLRRRDSLRSVYMQGNQCYFKDTGGKERRKSKQSVDRIPKRVTFKMADGEPDTKEDCDDKNKSNPDMMADFRLMRRKVDDGRLELAKNMNRHLLDVYQRKQFERAQPIVYDKHRKAQSDSLATVNNPLLDDSNVDTSLDSPGQQPPDSPRLESHSPASEERRQSYNKRRRDPSRSTRGTQKPLIRGLVVDSASNQKPSIVRASKNANIREEFALQQKIAGYNKSCSQSVNTIKIAQRRLSIRLQKLRSKMAQDKMDEKQLLEFRNTSDQLFLRYKGYLPPSKDSTGYFCFPPLKYEKRRVLSCH